MGAIHPISEWVLREACRQHRASFRRGDLRDLVVAALAAAVPPGLLELEITESAVLDDPENAAQILAELREMGIGIVLDGG
jgi:EAL domain-containing protein (putative c-di-GMP-specific phosphodiesterase class I)